MYLRYAKIREAAITPRRSHPTDAGIDFYVPKDFNGGVLASVEPGGSILINSGIKVEIPFGFMGIFCNKSGVASKKNLVLGAHVIDTFYDGEVIINLHNIGNEIVFIEPGEKIVQLVLVPVVCSGVTEVNESELYTDFKLSEYRGAKGFGATDKT